MNILISLSVRTNPSLKLLRPCWRTSLMPVQHLGPWRRTTHFFFPRAWSCGMVEKQMNPTNIQYFSKITCRSLSYIRNLQCILKWSDMIWKGTNLLILATNRSKKSDAQEELSCTHLLMLEPRRSYTAICPNPPWRPVADAFVSQSCVTPASCRTDIKFRQVQVSL